MNLQELLEVQIRDLLAILRAQKLGQLGVRDDATLELGVEAAVVAHICRNELGHIRLRALRPSREAHEGRQLVGDGAELEERVVRTASLVCSTLLRVHRRRVAADAALGVTSLALDCLRSLGQVTKDSANKGAELCVQGAHTLSQLGQNHIGRASLSGSGERSLGSIRGGRLVALNGQGSGGRGGNRDIDDGLGGSLRGSGGLGGSRHRVYITG